VRSKAVVAEWLKSYSEVNDDLYRQNILEVKGMEKGQNFRPKHYEDHVRKEFPQDTVG
jgi:hypothetical protein